MIEPIGVRKESILLTFSLDGTIEFDQFKIQLFKSNKEKILEYQNSVSAFWGYRPEQKHLDNDTEYHWDVVLLKNEKEVYRANSFFETGGIVSGQWIENGTYDGSIQHFQRVFQCDEQEKAYLVISGLGYYDFTINHTKMDETYFKPVVTNYDVRKHPEYEKLLTGGRQTVTYDTYDVTSLLKTGENVLDVKVAGGFYHNKDQACVVDVSYAEPKLYFELQFKNGRKICSDENCLVGNTNAVSTLFRGDRVDFAGTPEPMHAANKAKAPTGQPIFHGLPNDRVQQRIKPKEVRKLSRKETIYDFGKNHSGTVSFKAVGNRGEKILVKFAEILYEDGNPNYETATWHGCDDNGVELDTILQENCYYLSGGVDQIEPLFSWKGYRYVVIEAEDNVEISDMESLFICMPLAKDSYFECSEPIFNKLENAFRQTLYSNMHSGLISDCPHREKLPYTGDGHMIAKAVLYELDSIPYLRKWLGDILDAQTNTGQVPNAAPAFVCGGGYAWGNAICTVPRNLYQFTGDIHIVRESYPYIVKWLEYYSSKHDGDYIIRRNGQKWMLGDWLAPEAVRSNVYYISTVCYLQAAKCAREFAVLLEDSDSSKWGMLCDNIKQAINRSFFDQDKLLYGNGIQGENMLALAEDIVPSEYKKLLEEKVAYHYSVETDFHLDTGIVLTPMLIGWLTDNGYEEIAYRIMTQKSYPSYHCLLENETTLSEHWSKKWPDYYLGDDNSRLVKGGGDLSHSHPMYGSIVSWLYDRVAGLDLSKLSEKRVRICPSVTEQMEHAKAWKNTAFGMVSVSWTREGNSFSMQIDVPKNLDIECEFPMKEEKLIAKSDGNKITIYNQNNHFNFKLPAGSWTVTNEVKNQ